MVSRESYQALSADCGNGGNHCVRTREHGADWQGSRRERQSGGETVRRQSENRKNGGITTMEKKYRLLENDTITINGRTLYRIEALRYFADVEKGDKGGYV